MLSRVGTLREAFKKKIKKLEFSNFVGGGVKNCKIKDLLQIHFKPFWVILDTLFLVTFRGGYLKFLSVLSLQGEKNMFSPKSALQRV